jgi:Tfp pilus assembly protein PilF
MSAYLLDLLFAAGEPDQAIELAESEFAGLGEKEQIVGLQRLASAYARADRATDEIKTRRAVVQKLPDDSKPEELFEAQAALAGTLARHGQYEEAVNLMNSNIAKAASDAVKTDLLRRLSYIHQQEGRLDLTEARLREAHELAPLDVGLNNDFGYTLADMGKDLDEAERMIRIAVGEQPRQAAYQDSLGWVLYKKGDITEARTWLTRACALEGGQDPVIYDHLGDIHWRLDEKEEATKAWNKALTLSAERVAQGAEPNDEQVSRLRAKLDAVAAGQAPEIAPIVETENASP